MLLSNETTLLFCFGHLHNSQLNYLVRAQHMSKVIADDSLPEHIGCTNRAPPPIFIHIVPNECKTHRVPQLWVNASYERFFDLFCSSAMNNQYCHFRQHILAAPSMYNVIITHRMNFKLDLTANTFSKWWQTLHFVVCNSHVWGHNEVDLCNNQQWWRQTFAGQHGVHLGDQLRTLYGRHLHAHIHMCSDSLLRPWRRDVLRVVLSTPVLIYTYSCSDPSFVNKLFFAGKTNITWNCT
jgi:hypothetical protein